MASPRQSLGRWGESLAAEHLAQQGYTILARNFRSPYGEIDLIAQENNTLVFIEVKTRSSGAYGLPEEAITARKRQHLVNTAQAYLQAHPQPEMNWRIDVIAIRKPPGSTPPEIVHFENALT